MKLDQSEQRFRATAHRILISSTKKGNDPPHLNPSISGTIWSIFAKQDVKCGLLVEFPFQQYLICEG